MSSLGRGRGILPSRNNVPLSGNIPSLPKLMTDVRGPVTNGHTQIKIPPQMCSLARTSSPNLHNFGEGLLSLKENDSLFPWIMDIINAPSCNDEMVSSMIKILVDRSMWVPIVSRKYASLLTFITTHKLYGKAIKSHTLNALQAFYDDRESLPTCKTYGDDTFRNAVGLTGEIFYWYRIQGNRLRVLSGAMLDYLKLLVVSFDEKNLQVLTQQLLWSGNELYKFDETKFNELMTIIRTNLTIHSLAYTDISRCFLLLCLDLYHHQFVFEALQDHIIQFYIANLGKDTLFSLKPPVLEQDGHIEYYNTIRKFFMVPE